ncbi:hypothetical protein ACS0TY_009746 [Phlomoides rotata]
METQEEQWVRTTDFTQSRIGQSSGLCLRLPVGMRLPNFNDSFAYYKESEHTLVLKNGVPFSENQPLVPIVKPPRDLELPYGILFKVCSLVQMGCLPGPKLGEHFFHLVNPKTLDIKYIEHALEKLYYQKDCCYDPVKWLVEQYQNYKTLPKSPSIRLDEGQLMDNSLWMFAPTADLDADGIRQWMGDFSKIKNVAKYAARLGQSFGSSKETLSVGSNEIEKISDVTKGTKYTFSDGIGKISAAFAMRVAVKCGIRDSIPSAFQIRYGGYKGVVAVDPDPNSSVKLSLRPSMLKYDSDNTKLDVLAWSKYQPCFLNRQIITLLSTLGVRDHVFEMRQREAVAQLDAMLVDPLKAEETLDLMAPGECTYILKELLNCGYKPNVEPFLSMLLQAFCASKLLDLRTKARIFLLKARQMMGCMDETGTLEYGQDLIPTRQCPPMNYDPAPNTVLDHEVMIEEVEEYFTNYIVNDSLGIIANAHTVFADKKEEMALNEDCLELARLFSIAVDFPKTGVPAEIPPKSRVKEYPDFMEKPDKKTYESKRIIGKLFREVKDISPSSVSFRSFTKEVARSSYDIDMEVVGFRDYIDEAFDFKMDYDYKLGNLMDYFGVKTEAEIQSGSIMRMSKNFDRRKDAEAVGAAVRSLRHEARSWFKKGSEADDVHAKASAWYHVTYHPDYWGCYNEGLNRDHYISFPWCVYDTLVQIKKENSRSIEIM